MPVKIQILLMMRLRKVVGDSLPGSFYCKFRHILLEVLEILTCLAEHSSASQHISSLAHGSTTTDTVHVVGIYYLTVTQSAMFHICSKIGRGR